MSEIMGGYLSNKFGRLELIGVTLNSVTGTVLSRTVALTDHRVVKQSADEPDSGGSG